MTNVTSQRSVRFEPHQLMQLEQLALETKRSVPDLVRTAVANYLSNEKKQAESHLRHLRVSEYMQICLDWMIQQDHPEMRDQLIAQCDQRMQQYHIVR